MGPNPPEQNPPEKSMAQRAQEAADHAIAQIHANYDARFAQANSIQNDEERIRVKAQIAQEAAREIRKEINQLKTGAESGQVDRPEDVKEKADNAKITFLKIKELNKEGVNVVDSKSQLFVDKIVEKIKSGDITDQDALAIERILGKQLLDGVVFSPGDQLSTTEEGIRDLLQVNPQTGAQIAGIVAANPETFGTTADNLRQKLNLAAPNVDKIDNSRGNREDALAEQIRNLPPEQRARYLKFQEIQELLGNDIQYYQSRFTDDQLELITTFYSPEKFVDYMERLSNTDSKGKYNPDGVQNEKHQIELDIKDYYEKNHKSFESGDSLEKQVEKHWGEKVSNEMSWRVSDVINQLFLELQQKSPNKFYEEIMQEDPFQGPRMIQTKIQAALNSLMTKVDQISKDKNNPLNEKISKLKLYRTAADPGNIEERSGDPNDVNKKLYPRLHPLPYGDKIKHLTDFVQYIYTTIDQTVHKAEYFHNSRAIYNHPAGEKGFYGQLGGFAEMLKGADIDEIMLLPDGKYIMQAYQLYEKMLEEDFAQLDWKHRPDQFTNQLERVNSNIEIEVFEQLKAFHPGLSDSRLNNIRNSARGIATGIFLTEPEKSAYADAVDSEGQGMVASYSTNDAQSLNVFNPLHNALRWQGEHNWNMMYFMPVEGQKGPWNHKQAWNNMAKYMESFIVGKGRGTGKNKLPILFADAMIDINEVGGPNKRKGWRMAYSLNGHFEYDDDNTINAPKTFRAMEAIGYEAIANFIDADQLGQDLLRATDRTAPGQVQERNKMFEYIYKRYFIEDPNSFKESDFNDYMARLRENGEAILIEKIQNNDIKTPTKGSFKLDKNGKPKFDESLDASYDEMVQYETSQLFMENTKAHYVATKFPTKFLRIDRNRFTEDGVSLWEKVYREFRDRKDDPWSREKFDKTMKDLNMAEMLLGEQKSELIRKQITMDKEWKLSMMDEKKVPFRLNKAKIKELLEKNKDKGNFKDPEEVARAIELWEHIRKNLYDKDPKYDNKNYLDAKAVKAIKNYKFTFGLEDTDISLIPYRATGPRMVARAIKDTGSIEQNVTQWMLKMPDVMSDIAVNGKHDFSPLIEYLRTAKKAINDVHGSEGAQKFAYKIAGAAINYFKKDAMAKPLFGLFGIGKRNSMAAEYSGRSSGVWEWDSRDIDRFCVALESYRIIPLNPYDSNKTAGGKFIGGDKEDRWIKLPFLKKPIKFGKRRHVDFEFNGAKLRKEHGADWKAITWDMVNQFLPLAMAFLLWKYIKDAMDEAEGKKKQ